VSDQELSARRVDMESRKAQAWKPKARKRQVSPALQAYAAMTTSADTGAVRDISQLKS
jgi:dihydroxy-acid dehydratase